MKKAIVIGLCTVLVLHILRKGISYGKKYVERIVIGACHDIMEKYHLTMDELDQIINDVCDIVAKQVEKDKK